MLLHIIAATSNIIVNVKAVGLDLYCVTLGGIFTQGYHAVRISHPPMPHKQ